MSGREIGITFVLSGCAPELTVGCCLSGGTADVLPAERKKASFDVNKLMHVLDGGPQMTAKRRFIMVCKYRCRARVPRPVLNPGRAL